MRPAAGAAAWSRHEDPSEPSSFAVAASAAAVASSPMPPRWSASPPRRRAAAGGGGSGGGGGWNGGGHWHGGCHWLLRRSRHPGYYLGPSGAASPWASASATGRLLRRLLRRLLPLLAPVLRRSYYYPTLVTAAPTTRWSRVRRASASRCRRRGAARADLLSDERPERRSDRVRSARMQSLGDDPARRDGRRQHLPARDVRVHGRAAATRSASAHSSLTARARPARPRDRLRVPRGSVRKAAWITPAVENPRRTPGRLAAATTGNAPALGSGNERDELRRTFREDVSARLPTRRCRHRLRARHRGVDPPLRCARARARPGRERLRADAEGRRHEHARALAPDAPRDRWRAVGAAADARDERARMLLRRSSLALATFAGRGRRRPRRSCTSASKAAAPSTSSRPARSARSPKSRRARPHPAANASAASEPASAGAGKVKRSSPASSAPATPR